MIKVEKLEKTYGGRRALKGISFEVERGVVLGFLGPNGAGKTTTMKILTGLIPASAGRASVAGFDVHEQSLDVRRRLGYLPENPPLYKEMVVRDYLQFAADLKLVPRSKRKVLVERAIEQCGLGDVAGRICGRLSKGYRQRVGLAQAILHEPDVLIMDEPTIGLDPRQVVDIRSLIKGLGGDRTVVLSTHILPEVTMTCEKVVIINKGEILASDTIEGLTGRTGFYERLAITLARPPDKLDDVLRSIPGIVDIRTLEAASGRDERNGHSYQLSAERGFDGRERIAEALVQGGYGLIEMRTLSASLEEVFLEVITEENEVQA